MRCGAAAVPGAAAAVTCTLMRSDITGGLCGM